ncbi:GNAT family N-acetyltransferase [Salinivibrio sp. ES.052]|uniref:GNAT family N-acetyltransferase n=1 Tax=Salinivibrio sp. ES.052 TaxID=1882823 RepID=UPI0009414D6A|nr:GNAT family N-acetyltransferase [Salinivibrio sp. ES.052]
MQEMIVTERLCLRPFEPQDATRVAELLANKVISEMTSNIPYPYTESDAASWIASHRERYENRTSIIYAVTLKQTGDLIGTVSLPKLSDGLGILGYWLGVPYWGNGYATEASKALIAHCKKHFGLKRLHVTHLAENQRSKSVVTKIGIQHVRNITSTVRGLPRDLCIYESDV